jgi:hypothetical protein
VNLPSESFLFIRFSRASCTALVPFFNINDARLHNNNNGWIGGVGMENGAVTYSSGSNQRFYVGTGSVSPYGKLAIDIDGAGNVVIHGNLTVNGTIKAIDNIKVLTPSTGKYIQLNSTVTNSRKGGSGGTSIVSSDPILQTIFTTDPTGNTGTNRLCSFIQGNLLNEC